MEIKSKLPQVGTSIFAVMSKLAAENNAINLSQGFPDFNCSDELLELVNFYMKKGFNQYAPMPGVPSLRSEIINKTEQLYNRKYDVDTEVTVTSGATEALYAAITCLIQKDDEAIIFEPAYDSYIPVIEASGGKTVPVTLEFPDYKINWDEVDKKITKNTKLLILNSPHNPTGTIITKHDINSLERIVSKHDLFVISDEVYEHILFDGEEHLSLAVSDILYKRSFIISSFGKTFHATGWKVGYVLAPEIMMNEFRKLHQFIVFAVNTPVQFAYADYLKSEENYLSLNNFYQQKRDLFLSLIKDSKFNFYPCKGTYFQLLDYSEISDENDLDFTIRLIKENGIATIPLSPFYSSDYNEKILRICFAKNDPVLKDSSEILNKL